MEETLSDGVFKQSGRIRLLCFLTGVFWAATGIAFITRAGLGTSPISGVSFVLTPSPWGYTRLLSAWPFCRDGLYPARKSGFVTFATVSNQGITVQNR
ncbi:MAG: hypothetical protein ACLSE7_08915 [Lachnospirales bacterium]